jgi:hypothetical protein
MLLVDILFGYLIGGFAFAIYFLCYKLMKIDSNANGTSWTFRLMILPGVILLWPILILKKKVIH